MTVKPLFTMLSEIRRYVKGFDKTKYKTFLIKDDELLKNAIKYGVKSTAVFKKDLIATQFTVKNILQLK